MAKGSFTYKKWTFPIHGKGKLTKADVRKVSRLRSAIQGLVEGKTSRRKHRRRKKR